MAWEAVAVNEQDVHTHPLGDVIGHELDSLDGCICGPDVEFLHGARSIVHHALDRREHSEPDHDRDACPLCSSQNAGAGR